MEDEIPELDLSLGVDKIFSSSTQSNSEDSSGGSDDDSVGEESDAKDDKLAELDVMKDDETPSGKLHLFKPESQMVVIHDFFLTHPNIFVRFLCLGV